MSTTAKFTCIAKTQRKHWNPAPPFTYEYEFQAVTGNSEENKSFFASTPGGNIKLSVVRDDQFQPGQDYYVEFRAVE